MPKQYPDQLRPTGATAQPLLRTLFISSVILTFLLTAIYLFTPTGKFLDLRAIDFLLSTTVQDSQTSKTVTIAIDDNSLQQYGQWPWPRYRIAMLLDKIQQSGATTISVNILFPEPDRTSPIHWQNALHHDLGYSVDTSAVPKLLRDHDAYLANTLTHSNAILGYELLFTPPQIAPRECTPVEAPLDSNATVPPSLSFYSAHALLCNNETLNRANTPSGFFNGVPDQDGILRRLPLLLEFNGKTYPSFALQTLLQAKDINNITINTGPFGTRYINPGNIPIDRKGNYLISGQPQAKAAHISATELLSDGLDASLLKNKIVFVGITASGLAKNYRLATNDNISMVDIHKLAYQSLSSDRHSVRGDFFWVIELLLTYVLTLLLLFLVARLSTPWFCTILLAIIGILGAGSFYLAWGWGLLFSPLFSWSCLLLNFFILVTFRYKFFQQRSASEAGNALQLLETSQETLQSILNTIPDIVFRLDSSGRIIFISSAVTRYKRMQTPLLGRSIFDLVIPEDLEKSRYKLNERRTGARATYDFEVRLRFNLDHNDSEGEIRYFSVSAAGLYQDNLNDLAAFIGTQGIVKDITQRKQIERQLLQAKKMEAMGNLAAGIAHDLNNILSGLVSYPDMILADTPVDDPLHKKISLIKKSGQKAAVIVQDLLTLARKNIQHQEVCDLGIIITDYLESTEHNQALQNHSDITITTDIHSQQTTFIGSSVHISKTVMNLVNNAMEAMPDGGNIQISTSNTNLNEPYNGYEVIPLGHYVCLKVTDSGTGIPTAEIPMIFEPFYTHKPTPSKGTGLGMTIIWATVKDHEGFIDITSKEDRGTVFTLYLPATGREVAKRQKQLPPQHSTGNEIILIVDDLEEQLIIGTNILNNLGYTVVTAQKSKDALKILENQGVDLVILDMIMPGQLDGLETYREILKLRPNQKAIIASGYSESDRVKKMQDLGAGSYIQKPYSMEELAHAVRTELDR